MAAAKQPYPERTIEPITKPPATHKRQAEKDEKQVKVAKEEATISTEELPDLQDLQLFEKKKQYIKTEGVDQAHLELLSPDAVDTLEYLFQFFNEEISNLALMKDQDIQDLSFQFREEGSTQMHFNQTLSFVVDRMRIITLNKKFVVDAINETNIEIFKEYCDSDSPEVSLSNIFNLEENDILAAPSLQQHLEPKVLRQRSYESHQNMQFHGVTSERHTY